MPVDLEITTTVATLDEPGHQLVASKVTPSVQLRFAPAAGIKHVMRVRTVLTAVTQGTGVDQHTTDDATFTFDLAPAPAETDGTVPMTVTLMAVRHRVDDKGAMKIDYDSTRPQDRDSSRGRFYTRFLNKPCVIHVSSRGRIVDLDAHDLFHTAAEESIKISDQRRKEQSGESAPTRPLEERIQSRADALKNLPLFAGNTFAGLVGELVSTLPEAAMREGDTWDEPIRIPQVEGLTMPTKYSVTAVEDGTCKIQADGGRSREDEPIVQKNEQYTVTHRLGGTYHATLVLDRQTGWLLSKEQTTSFGGQSVSVGNNSRNFDANMQIAQEMTTTVTTME